VPEAADEVEPECETPTDGELEIADDVPEYPPDVALIPA
jgi:hypothetical protein